MVYGRRNTGFAMARVLTRSQPNRESLGRYGDRGVQEFPALRQRV